MLGNRGSDDLGDRLIFHSGNCGERIGLFIGQPNRHRFGGLHMVIVWLGTTVVNSIDTVVSCNRNPETTMNNIEQSHPKPHINIQIDRVHYKVELNDMTGQQLRALPNPPIQSDRDLFLVVPGGHDLKIGLDEVVHLADGMRFFTAPGHINPGRRYL